MNIDEMIDVMKAYKDGKTIEHRLRTIIGDEWGVIEEIPCWDFSYFDYRVKPEPKYAPYDSVMEVERDKWAINKCRTVISRVVSIDIYKQRVFIDGVWFDLTQFFNDFEYEDGSPCGKVVQNND